jgi:hypothetical protein
MTRHERFAATRPRAQCKVPADSSNQSGIPCERISADVMYRYRKQSVSYLTNAGCTCDAKSTRSRVVALAVEPDKKNTEVPTNVGAGRTAHPVRLAPRPWAMDMIGTDLGRGFHLESRARPIGAGRGAFRAVREWAGARLCVSVTLGGLLSRTRCCRRRRYWRRHRFDPGCRTSGSGHRSPTSQRH